MRKLYWFECEEKEVNDGIHLNHNRQMGGLGLTTAKVLVKGGANKEDNQLLGMLSIKVGFSQDVEEVNKGRLVTVRNLDTKCYDHEEKEERQHPDCFITSGEDYFKAYREGVGEFTKLIKETPIFLTTHNGEKALNWDVNLLQVIPMYDGELDKEWGYWDMFEEEGYIYGMDKRTGDIFDLQHFELEFMLPLSNDRKRVELWVISNQPVLSADDVISAMPMGRKGITSDLADWVQHISREHFDYTMTLLSRTKKVVERLTVERYK